MTITTTDSRYAADAFADRLEWSKARGAGQLRHFHTKLTEDFGNRVHIGLVTAIKDDLLEKFEVLSAAGIVDQHDDPGVPMSVVTLAEGKGVSVRFADGAHLLLAWKTGDDGRFELAAFPWRDKMPADLVREIEQTVKASPTKAALDGLAARAREFSNLTPGDEDLIYTGLHLSIDDLKGYIADIGFDDTNSRAGFGEYWSYARTYGGDVVVLTVDGFAHHPGIIGYAEKLVTVFDTKYEIEGFSNRDPHLPALLEGRLSELHSSACALAMEFNLRNGMDAVSEIVENCETLRLSTETSYAYGDEDRIVYAERYEGRDLYLHNNIDLNEGCAYATVLSRNDGEVVSCDVYLVERWRSGFEANYGADIAETADERMASEYLLYAVKAGERRRIPEDRLVQALREGFLPTEGRFLSCDMATGAMEIDTELARNTGYLDYFRLMTEGDREALAEAIEGTFKGWGETFLSRQSSDGPNGKVVSVEPTEYLAGLASPAKAQAAPKP